MKLDEKLNLIMPVMRAGDTIGYVISQPLDQRIFKAYYMPVAKTWAKMYQEGLHLIGGPPVAKDMLEDVARNTARGDGSANWWDGPLGVENGFLNEIWRITQVMAPDGAGGWRTLIYPDAKKANLLADDEIEEVEGALVFFMLNWRMLRAEVRRSMMAATGTVWGWRLTSSSISEFRASLQQSTQPETSDSKETASVIMR